MEVLRRYLEYDEILQKANMFPRVRPCISFEWSPVLS